MARGLTRAVLVCCVLASVWAVSIAAHDASAQVAPAGAGRFVPVSPERLLDTRIGLGAPVGTVPSDGTIELMVAGRAGVPADAVAVAMNVTATNSTGAGYVTVWPTGQLRPNASNLNVGRSGQTIANLVVVPLGGGRVSLYAQTATDLVADVAGYWLPSGPTAAGRLIALNPARVLDTRDGNGAARQPVAGGSHLEVQIAGRGGVPAAGVSAVVLNVTATGTTGPGYVTVWPGGLRPIASNLNVETAGQTIPNLVVAPLNPDGRASLFAQTTTHLVADVAGYITDATAAVSGDGLFVPLTPERLVDTRTRAQRGGLYTAAEVVGGYRADLVVAGNRTVPATGVAAVIANVTATNTTNPGFVTVHPAATQRPNASNLNVDRAGQTIPNLALARLGYAGRISLYAQNDLDLIVDVAGYFTGQPAPAEAGVPLDPPVPPPPTTTTVPPPTPPPTTSPTTVAPPPPPPPPAPPGNPGDVVNCSDFATWGDAQAWYDTYAPHYGDIAHLDSDGDGIACETLPGAPQYFLSAG